MAPFCCGAPRLDAEALRRKPRAVQIAYHKARIAELQAEKDTRVSRPRIAQRRPRRTSAAPGGSTLRRCHHRLGALGVCPGRWGAEPLRR